MHLSHCSIYELAIGRCGLAYVFYICKLPLQTLWATKTCADILLGSSRKIIKFKPVAAPWFCRWFHGLRSTFQTLCVAVGAVSRCHSQAIATMSSVTPHQPPLCSSPSHSRSLNRSILHPHTEGASGHLHISNHSFCWEHPQRSVQMSTKKNADTKFLCVNK